MARAVPDFSFVFIELGCAIVGLALLARLANRWGFSAIPLYLLAGLAFGNGGVAPLDLSENFIHIGAEIGVLLLLFMLGLEYTGSELQENLRKGLPAGVVDLALNFPPGLIVGLLLGWRPLAAILLGGITYISSSGGHRQGAHRAAAAEQSGDAVGPLGAGAGGPGDGDLPAPGRGAHCGRQASRRGCLRFHCHCGGRCSGDCGAVR